MRTSVTVIALIAILTTATALAQGLTPPTNAYQIGAYEYPAYAGIQATGPALSQAVLSRVAASAAPHAGRGPMIGRGGGPGSMGGHGNGMNGMKGPWPGNKNWRGHAQGNKGYFHHFPHGYSPWGNMYQYPNMGPYNMGSYANPYGYGAYGGSYFNSYGGYNYYPNYYGYPYWNPGYYYYPNYAYYGW